MERTSCIFYCTDDGNKSVFRSLLAVFCVTFIIISPVIIIPLYHDKSEYNKFFEHEYNCTVNSIEYDNCPDIIINITIEELNITIQEQVNFKYESGCNEFIINNFEHPRVTCSYFEDELVLGTMINTNSPFWFDVSIITDIIATGIILIMYLHFKLIVNKPTCLTTMINKKNDKIKIKNNVLESRNLYLESSINDLNIHNSMNNVKIAELMNTVKDLENQVKVLAPPTYETK